LKLNIQIFGAEQSKRPSTFDVCGQISIPQFQRCTTTSSISSEEINRLVNKEVMYEIMDPSLDSSNNLNLQSPQNEDTNSTETISPLSDFYIVSPPPRNPSHRRMTKDTSPTPPPCSEKINRAIRTAEHNLNAAVETVQRYICQKYDGVEGGQGDGGSPESEYSDDFLFSPKNLPDFRNVPTVVRSPASSRSPMKSICEDTGTKYTGMRRRIFEESDDEEDIDQFDNNLHDEEVVDDGEEEADAASLDADMSKLNIDSQEQQESDGESDDSSVMIVNTKSFKRRVIDDDDDSSVESETNFSTGAGSAKSDAADEKRETTLESEPLLGDAFSGLALDNEEAQDEKESVTIQSINSADSDDEDITFTEGCGCWTMDKETKDLYLPPESGKWPRIRLPFATYQKLYRHQRIGIQWMASLHRNTIKGGILADDMGMVRYL
jgi:SNF2 family DNA or RNA helicase